MEQILDFIGITEAQFLSFQTMVYYALVIIIKSLFVVYTAIFILMSFVRFCDNENPYEKKIYFRDLAILGIVALVVFLGWGYNNIIVLGFFAVSVRYWSTDQIRIWTLVRSEWESDFIPKFRMLMEMFKNRVH